MNLPRSESFSIVRALLELLLIILYALSGEARLASAHWGYPMEWAAQIPERSHLRPMALTRSPLQIQSARIARAIALRSRVLRHLLEDGLTSDVRRRIFCAS